MARCLICFLRFPKLNKLFVHYLKFHKKNKIIYKLLETNALNSRNSLFKCHKKYKHLIIPKTKRKTPDKKIKTFNVEDLPTESLVLSENIRIFCGDNEIIRIGDGNHSVKLSFENNENESKEICCLALKEIESDIGRCVPESVEANKKTNTDKKKNKRKKVVRKKKQNYQINITKVKEEPQSPSNQNDSCLDPPHYPKSDLRLLLTSDTESCSDTSKNSFIPIEDSKLFCSKCGSGYKTENELSEHMYIHEPFCRLCNTWFPDEFTFKQHMQLHKIRIFVCHVCSAEFPFKEMLFKHFDCHMENKLFEDVLDMEEEYKTFPFSFVNSNYNTSINSILCYLKDRPDLYYCNYKLMKTVCDICYREVFIHEYERHLQIFHSY